MPYIAVAIGGFIGAILRYGVSEWLGTWNGLNIATLLTNFAGCLALGWLNTISANRLPLHPNVRLGIGTGVIGAFTTFSTFTIDAWKLFENGAFEQALTYIWLSVIGGLLFTYVGYRIASAMTGDTRLKI
ncbi:fluoride efflux transporter CrcB [Alicyclobacillus dauci]|uniref:Fluoride-specific ion channel FluC n=1 Tax=Alicyclobacillus dauci TaxID=1475485 RepID=A0ABY6Z6K8_9BACL|nr:fluoride efflux transporter CrcB [Alicyclobacillus dauci]WAH38505.1 fluoride efflux transporter CrcB [Alicyclobacillus dauci]